MKNNSLIGRTLANFEIKRLLGHGGMAEVYYGWDVKLQRPVAIKVFETESPANPSQASRFIQEARMMAKWRHDNIVPIYYADDENDLFYYVMEYIDGYDLSSIMFVYIDKGELMPIDDVLRIGNAVASALDYAHGQGVIHRDVKPANVMIANDGRVVLGDFGLALDQSKKSLGEVFGSPHYIAPEQARRSSDAVPQSDLYALGVILFEMLTGATPFNDPSPTSLALQHIVEPPPSPRSINPALSEQVENVLLKALEKDPTNRYQSGRELMDALGSALGTEAIATPADAPPLPPIPVNAPTIHRSNIPLDAFTKREDVVTVLEKRTTAVRHRADAQALPVVEHAPKKRYGWVVLLLLLAVLGMGWKFRVELFSLIQQLESAPVIVATATKEQPVIVQISPTSSPSPVPTRTKLVVATNTIEALVSPSVEAILSTTSPVPTTTATVHQVSTPSSTPAFTATVAVSPTPTILYPNGHFMTAYYNATSFYIFNQGENVSRSVSGFSFERINNDGSFQNHFGGWEWEKYFAVIQPGRCINLEIHASKTPYLYPPECEKKILSSIELVEGSPKVFWTESDSSHQFRILWLNEEIARCEIDAGVCDFYIP